MEKRIRELSAEPGRPVDCLEWLRVGDPTVAAPFMEDKIPLRICRGGDFKTVEFQENDVIDAETDPQARASLEERMRTILAFMSRKTS